VSTLFVPRAGRVDVVELNPYAPRPFVFTDLAVCLRDSIQAAGWESIHRFNEVEPGTVSVVLGCLPPFSEIARQLDPRTTLIANFEQLGSTSALAGAEYQRWLAGRVVVDYHSRNIEHLKRENGSTQRAFELPIIPGPSIIFPPKEPIERTVDVLFFGSLNERRTALVRRLEDAGMRVEVVAGAYGIELAPAVQRARLVLHMHYYDTGLFPVARVLQPVANGVPVVCETSVFSQLSDWSRSGILFADYEQLVEACRRLLDSPREQAARVKAAQDFVREVDFAAALKRSLDALDGGPADAAFGEPDDPERLLTDAEIEAILEHEAKELPAESDRAAAPIQLVMRQPGQGRFGRWIAWLLVAFSLWTVWQSSR
jgi:hypothetical protein